MKYFVLALLVATAFAVEEISQEISIEDAAFAMNMMPMNRVARNHMVINPMMIPKPPQKAVDHYNSLNDADFPVDYSMSCSNSCGCRQTCVMMWWMPCSCMCPPPCPATTTEAPINRLPIVPPWNRPAPEPIPPQWQWQQPPPPPPNPQFPSFPNVNLPILTTSTTQAPLTFPPLPPRPAPPPCNSPPSWNNNNNNNNNNRPLTHPPPVTTPQPQWPWQNQPQPIWPQPQPEPEPQWPWQNQPQVPLPLPEPLPPTNNWNNNWNNNQNNWNNQFPNQWPQPEPLPEPIPPPRNDCNSCNNQCSCTPCSVVWVCPPPCPSNCCNGNCARHFGEAGPSNYENEADTFEDQNSNKIAFHHIPEYLHDIFIPGMI